MFKLKLYRFLGKFISYFKRKYIYMSLYTIIQQVATSLNNASYSQVTDSVLISNTTNREYAVIFDIHLHTLPYFLKIKVSSNNGVMNVYQYNTYVNIHHSSWQTIDIINNINTEVNTIEQVLNNINPILSRIFSTM